MSRTGAYEQGLAMLSYPQQTYRMVNTGSPDLGYSAGSDEYGSPFTKILGGVAAGIGAVMTIRNAERMSQTQMEMAERSAQMQQITAATIEQKRLQLDADKRKFYPIYLATGLLFFGVLGVVVKTTWGQ
jgi:hypothetical protein